MIYRLILPQWAKDADPHARRVLEGEFTPEEIAERNASGYNIYYLPNRPSEYDSTQTVEGSHVDLFEWCFVDMDLKDGVYADKSDFIEEILANENPSPTRMIDSGNGIHAYYKVSDLDAMSFLRLQRRLIRKFQTDEAVGQIFQLMRAPGTVNTKQEADLKLCEEILTTDTVYTCEQMDSFLPPITQEDEAYCRQHYDKTYKVSPQTKVDDRIPPKFATLLRNNSEVKDIWKGGTDDRSKSDYRLGHIMFAEGFSRSEALSVLVNAAKALARAPIHRISYAERIVDKIWTFEETEDKTGLDLSESVKDILQASPGGLQGTRFPCWPYLDATHHGFKLGQVIGLVAGSGVGKTAMALNMFEGFVKANPDYYHFFIPLEQPAHEIAARWKVMCGDNIHLHDKVHVISNYEKDGSFRHLSLDNIQEYIVKFQTMTSKKVGCVVIDHIGALKKKGKDGENQDLMDICHAMKAVAIKTNTMLVMQSQAPREKAGIGDLELNKDAAYGTVYFESYCDYLITIWQPLKRCYSDEGCPSVTAFKFCKIRHKKRNVDEIQEDVCYRLYFDPDTERMRELTEVEEKAFDFFNTKATNKRKLDRKTDIGTYKGMSWTQK